MRDAPFVLDAGLPTVKSLAEDGDLIIEGWAADFESDRQGEAFLPGAFDEACAKAVKDEIPLLEEHDNKRQLGVVEALKSVAGKGLWMRARIAAPKAGSWAVDSVDKIRRGMKKGLSVRGMSSGVYTKEGPRISTIDLAEISVTPVPVQPGALFAVAQKSLAYAADSTLTDAPDVAWAAESWGQVVAKYTPQEIQDAVDAYYRKRFAEARTSLASCQAAIDKIHG